MRVNLTYFKNSGKYYTDGFYNSEKEHLFEIWDEVRNMQKEGKLPGLMEGCGREFIIHVDVPEHEYNHPHLINPYNE